MRRLIRRMHRENWSIEQKFLDLDGEGYGVALYVVQTLERCYSLICFSHYLNPDSRTDRVIAEDWDTTFTLFDGVPKDIDIERLAQQTPQQEAGRFDKTDLVLSRANKSLRLFDYVVNTLAQGHQPNRETINEVGYLMRTTAVYANGKFGLADRSLYANRPELTPPYQAEMLTVYLIREFCLDLVDHIARYKAPTRAVCLNRNLKRHLGMGNATGLGMAPFLVDHPGLIHKWFKAREIALARIRSINSATPEKLSQFRALVFRSKKHVAEWLIDDKQQQQKILTLYDELTMLATWVSNDGEIINLNKPWDYLYKLSEHKFSVEGQELLVSLLLEPYRELVDELGEALHFDPVTTFNVRMTASEMIQQLQHRYMWALTINFDDPKESQYFWYYSQEKNEPRRGLRRDEPGVEKEMKIAVARDITSLYHALSKVNKQLSLAHFLLHHPELRHIARRVQMTSDYVYSEIQENIISSSCAPIDILRSKLAFFGASKFDPKSDLWTRITLCQGAPLRDELANKDVDDWCFPIQPAAC